MKKSEDINVIAFKRGPEKYLLLYDDDQSSEALRTVGRWASNPELSFSWYNAAILSQKIRNARRDQEKRCPRRFES